MATAPVKRRETGARGREKQKADFAGEKRRGRREDVEIMLEDFYDSYLLPPLHTLSNSLLPSLPPLHPFSGTKILTNDLSTHFSPSSLLLTFSFPPPFPFNSTPAGNFLRPGRGAAKKKEIGGRSDKT